MMTLTGNTDPEPLAALSARVMRSGLQLASDTPRWVQRAARRLVSPPTSSIGASVEAFTAGIAQRFPDVAARFAAPGESAERFAAIDMPFVSAQGLVEMAQEQTPAFESATDFLTHMRGTQPATAMAPPTASATLRTASRESAASPVSTTSSPLEVIRQRTAAARKPASQTPASPVPLQRKAGPAASAVQVKPARVISAVEEVPRKNAVARASLSPMTCATPLEMPESPKSPTTSPLEEAQLAGPAPDDASAAPPAMQRSDEFADTAPHVAETRSAPGKVPQQHEVVIQRKATEPRAVHRQNTTPQPHEAETTQAVVQDEQDALGVQRSSREMPIAAQAPQFEKATVARIQPSPLPAPKSDVVAALPLPAHEASNATPSAQPSTPLDVDYAHPHIQRRAEATVMAHPDSESHPPALPLHLKGKVPQNVPQNVPQLARAGQAAQQASGRIARMALPSTPSSLPLLNHAATMVDDASAATEYMDALDGWPALPADAPDVPTMSEAMRAAPFAMPAFELPPVPRNVGASSLRAALPQTPALPQLDMPFAQPRSAMQNIGAAPQMQARESFAALPSTPALPSLQGATSQMQTSANAAMAGGVNAASGVVQSGIAGANQLANSAVSAAQGALGALNGSTPKTDLDRLARQLLPHLKRVLALERERMRPF